MPDFNNSEKLSKLLNTVQPLEDIINSMLDWVRVIDKDDNVIYMNKSMSDAVGHELLGSKCYKVLGRSFPCENCISRRTVFEGKCCEKQEIIGDKIFSVKSSPVRNYLGEIIAVVEVLRDVTLTKQMEDKILEQNIKLQNDLDIAKRLQCSMLPKLNPMDKLDFSYVYQPCEQIGGDFLDIFAIDSNHVGVYVADVSGHGVPASLLTVFLRSSLNKKILSPAKALSSLYKEFTDSQLDHQYYITVFFGIIDLRDRSFIYSNAGHNTSPIVFNKNKLSFLRKPGIPISNWLEDPGYTDSIVHMDAGDRLFMYTDGLIEYRNEKGEQFGEERLFEILTKNKKAPSIVVNNILESVYSYAGVENPKMVKDDITMVLLELK